MISTLFFLWISSEIKFLQRLSTFPSILILIEIHILVQHAALSNFPSELKQEHLSTAITAIPVVHSMTCSGHPERNPDQCQGDCSALTSLRQSSASGFLWITTVTQSYWCKKVSILSCKKFLALQGEQ